jgi:hypothetical protein
MPEEGQETNRQDKTIDLWSLPKFDVGIFDSAIAALVVPTHLKFKNVFTSPPFTQSDQSRKQYIRPGHGTLSGQGHLASKEG